MNEKRIKFRFSPDGWELNENELGGNKIASDLEKRITNEAYSFLFVVYDLIDDHASSVQKQCKKFHSPKVTKIRSDICIEATLFKLLSDPPSSAPTFNNANKAKSRFHIEFCNGQKVSKKGAHNYDWNKQKRIGKEELLKFEFLKTFFKKLGIK